MKRPVLAGLLSATTLLVPAVEAKESVIILSPFASAETKERQIRAVSTFLAETTEPGETSVVVNGWTQDTVARFTVPEDAARYDRPSARMRANPAFFKGMKDFADAPAPAATDARDGQVDWPAIVRRIGRDFPAQTARDLIFYEVSPEYHDARAAEFSTRDGVLFSDAHLEVSRDVSPFGAVGQSRMLENYTVYWGTVDDAWVVSDRHLHHTERSLSLWFTAHSGTLATLATGGKTALENASRGISQSLGEYRLDSDGRPTMVHFRAQEVTPEVSIYERPLSDRTLSSNETRDAMDVEIAIRWSCACDFDLAVQVPGEQPISFRAPDGASGTLFKDFTSSQSLNNGWETIAMPGPIDLNALVIAVNKYSGASDPVTVELRIAIGGETWGQTFRLEGPADLGSGFERTLRDQAPANRAWAVISPQWIVAGR